MVGIIEGFVGFLILAAAIGIGRYHAVFGVLFGLVFYGLLVVLGIKDFLMVIGFCVLAIQCLVLVYGLFYDIVSDFFNGERNKNEEK